MPLHYAAGRKWTKELEQRVRITARILYPQLAPRCRRLIEPQDLEQEAWAAVLLAIHRYNPRRSKDVTFLRARIRGAMLDHVRRIAALTSKQEELTENTREPAADPVSFISARMDVYNLIRATVLSSQERAVIRILLTRELPISAIALELKLSNGRILEIIRTACGKLNHTAMRPPQPSSPAKTMQVLFRATPEFKEHIEAEALRRGSSIQDLITNALASLFQKGAKSTTATPELQAAAVLMAAYVEKMPPVKVEMLLNSMRWDLEQQKSSRRVQRAAATPPALQTE